MEVELLASFVLAVLLLAYLFVALLWPERFGGSGSR
jgi:K+-transporting ATPase KdpF subunit